MQRGDPIAEFKFLKENIVRSRHLKKANHILLFVALLLAGLYFGASLLIPLTFAVFFATLVLPLASYLEERFSLGRMASSMICTFLIFVGVGLIIFFLINQLGVFLNDVIDRKDEIFEYFQGVQENIAMSTGFSLERQEEMLRERFIDFFNFVRNYLTGVLRNVTGVLLNFLLILVYLFLLLLNRDKFVDFLMMYISREKQDEAGRIIQETRKVAHNYLWGRIQVMFLLAVMYLITFLAYDLEHTGLLVLFGALITIIPFIGPFISGLLPIFFLVIFGGSTLEVLTFTGIIVVIQLVESYVLEPVLIGSEVQQSPLFVVIAVIFGGLLWGPAGLILFVPVFAILKIIFDNSPRLKPVGFLMGYERPGSGVRGKGKSDKI